MNKLVHNILVGAASCIVVTAGLLLNPMAASAETDTAWQTDYDYSLDSENHEIILKQYKGEGGDIIIPAIAVENGSSYNVVIKNATSWDNSFFSKDNITSVTIKDGVRLDNGRQLFELYGKTRKNLAKVVFGNVTCGENTSMHDMFKGCVALTNLDLSKFNTSNVTDMHGMFWGCISLTELNLSGLDTSSVSGMGYMFVDCSSLVNLDLSAFETGNVTKMGGMFSGCSDLISLDLSGFTTNNVTDMFDMFRDCESLTSLNLSGFNTSNVTDMGHMFYDCKSLTSLDLSSFDTSNVTQMWSMFSDCESLTQLDLSSFDTSSLASASGMFEGCSELASLDLSGWDTRFIDNDRLDVTFPNRLGRISTPKLMSSKSQIKLPQTMYLLNADGTIGTTPYNYLSEAPANSIIVNPDKDTISFNCKWYINGGKSYWYEHGVRQGTYDDKNGVIGDGTIRGREIYDPESDGWYWLDSVYNGAKAVGKEVWIPYIYQDEDSWDDAKKREIANESDAGMEDLVYTYMKEKTGKWVRYDENGRMLKGWVTIKGALATKYPDQAGNTYYYDNRTGLMAKGKVTIDGTEHFFDEITGILIW